MPVHSHAHLLSPPSPEAVARGVLKAGRVAEAAGRRFTELRKHVYELLLADGGAVKAYDLLDRLKPEKGSAKPPTVYRALEFLEGLGLVHRIEALNAFVACDPEHVDLHTAERARGEPYAAEFFICTCCERVWEAHAPSHTDRAPEGFSIQRSVIERYGLCADCDEDAIAERVAAEEARVRDAMAQRVMGRKKG